MLLDRFSLFGLGLLGSLQAVIASVMKGGENAFEGVGLGLNPSF